MKILCVSDQIDPLVYSASLKSRYGDVELVLAAGDLPLDYLDFIVSILNRPLLSVFGNHNLEGMGGKPEADGISHIGGRVKKLNSISIDKNDKKGVIVAGLGGTRWYNGGKNQFSEAGMFFEMCRLIPKMILNRIFRGRFLDILLTHAAPRGIHDREDPCHRGFKIFNWFMRIFKPRYLVHGHIHLYDLSEVRVTRYAETMVVNAYSRYVLSM